MQPMSDYDRDMMEKKYEKELKAFAELLRTKGKNATLGEIEEILGGPVDIILGDNCSGVDVVNTAGTYQEYTW